MRFAFVATFVSGLLFHLFFLTNLDLNHDTWLSSGGMMWDTESLIEFTIMSGRWLQTYVDMVNGLPFMPWVMGLVCLFFLSLTTAFLVYLLKINRRFYALLAALAMVSFPSVASSLVYHSTGGHIALLLTVLSVYFTRRFRFGFLPGALLIMFSLAIYQAYIFAASALFVILMILELIDGGKTVKHTFIDGIKALIALGLGYASYTFVLNCVLRYTGLALSDYQGINQMDALTPEALWHALSSVYGVFFNVFYRSYDRMLEPVMPWVIIVIGALAVIALAWMTVKNRLWRQPHRIALILILAALFPLAVNGIYLLSPLGTFIYHLMLMPRVMTSLLCIALIARSDGMIENLPDIKLSGRVISAICWVQIALLSLAFYGNFLNVNEAYMKHDLAIRQATVFTKGLHQDILDTAGYRDGMKIYRIGEYASPLKIAPEYDIRSNWIFGFLTKETIIGSHSYTDFTAAYLGENLNFVFPVAPETIAPYEKEIREMPIYPAEGSILVVDGIVLLKLGDPPE